MLLALPAVAGCATGSSEEKQQSLALNTLPSRARCELSREGEGTIAKVVTPAFVKLQRSATPLKITCSAPGYETKKLQVEARSSDYFRAHPWETAALGSIKAGVSGGAAFGYPDTTITLVPIR
jgi:hypothetical protein